MGREGGRAERGQKYTWFETGTSPLEPSLFQGEKISTTAHDHNTLPPPGRLPGTPWGGYDQEKDYSGDMILTDTSQSKNKQIPTWEGSVSLSRTVSALAFDWKGELAQPTSYQEANIRKTFHQGLCFAQLPVWYPVMQDYAHKEMCSQGQQPHFWGWSLLSNWNQ